MLVLTRKPGQTLMLGNDIRVSVLQVHNNAVRIGIAAPDHIHVYRDELYEKICEQNRLAALHPDKTSLTVLGQVLRVKKED